MKPSWSKDGIRGANSYQRPRRFERISMRPLASRERNLAGTGDGGGRNGWYTCCCWELEEGVRVAEMGFREEGLG